MLCSSVQPRLLLLALVICTSARVILDLHTQHSARAQQSSYHDHESDFSDDHAVLARSLQQQPSSKLFRIPRIVHQTYKTSNLPEGLKDVSNSWKIKNGPSWEYHFYDDAACLEFVKREYPDYLAAFQSLPKNVERSDFFRYMVVLRYGGVYADMDVECRQPMEGVIIPEDDMVVGWEVEVATELEALKMGFVRRRQVLQWFFAAVPNHPALREVCDRIAATANRTFSNDTARDTLERTGPGVWTDVVLAHAVAHPVAEVDYPWHIRILPRSAFGADPAGYSGIPTSHPEVVVLHHFFGSWKPIESWRDCRTLSCMGKWAGGLMTRLAQPSKHPLNPAEPLREPAVTHFPVSTSFEPSFVMMVDLVGHGDRQAGSDVCATITNWGTWQAGLPQARKPWLLNTLIAALESGSDSSSNSDGSSRSSSGSGSSTVGSGNGTLVRRLTLVDVGAGQGIFSLAAAARGHRSIAFELSPRSLASLHASIRFNGFDALVDVQNVTLGAEPGTACLQRRGPEGAVDAQDVNIRRGYGDTAIHSTSPQLCANSAARDTLSNLLPNDSSVGALRISANGWEGWILEGAERWMRSNTPGVVLLELSGAQLRRAGYMRPALLLEHLYDMGYTYIAHAGEACERRWRNSSRVLSRKGLAGRGPAGSASASTSSESRVEPMWCRLPPIRFQSLMTMTDSEVHESVLLYHRSFSGRGMPALFARTAQHLHRQRDGAVRVQGNKLGGDFQAAGGARQHRRRRRKHEGLGPPR